MPGQLRDALEGRDQLVSQLAVDGCRFDGGLVCGRSGSGHRHLMSPESYGAAMARRAVLRVGARRPQPMTASPVATSAPTTSWSILPRSATR